MTTTTNRQEFSKSLDNPKDDGFNQIHWLIEREYALCVKDQKALDSLDSYFLETGGNKRKPDNYLLRK